MPSRTVPPSRRPWWIALALVLTLVVAAWYFVLRDSEASSVFVRASERYIAAVERIRGGAVDISRFLDLPVYDDMVDRQVQIIDKQTKVFERLARTEDGEAARIARDAADAAKRGRLAAFWYSESVINRKLTIATRADGELGAAMADLRLLITQWEQAK